MGAPKIKMYQLPAGYSEDGDNDVQQILNDEIVGVKDKPVLPEDWYQLVGIKQVEDETLTSINHSAGQINDTLTPDSVQFQAFLTGNTDAIINIAPSGHYSIEVIDSNLDVIDSSEYTATPSGVSFTNSPYPSGATVNYWRQGAGSNTHYISSFDSWYDGSNQMFIEFIRDDGDDPVDRDDYTIVAASGLVETTSAVTGLKADYTYKAEVTKYYIGDSENWIENHLYMSPDIFRGEYDYPGDDSEDDIGNPIIQGAIPEFVENSEYQIDFRRGIVTFPDEFDSSTEPVHASFAHLVGVRNVTGQGLDQVSADPSGGYVYAMSSDLLYPGSKGAKWLGRNDQYTPRNFYVDGEIKPQLITVSPFDTLTIKNV